MKNLQAKILFIFGIIGIVIIFGMGGFFHYIIDNANQMLLAGSNVETVYQTQLLQEKILIFYQILLPYFHDNSFFFYFHKILASLSLPFF